MANIGLPAITSDLPPDLRQWTDRVRENLMTAPPATASSGVTQLSKGVYSLGFTSITAAAGTVLIGTYDIPTNISLPAWVAANRLLVGIAGVGDSAGHGATFTGTGTPVDRWGEWSVKVNNVYVRDSSSGTGAVYINASLYAQVYNSGGSVITGVNFGKGMSWALYKLT